MLYEIYITLDLYKLYSNGRPKSLVALHLQYGYQTMDTKNTLHTPTLIHPIRPDAEERA